MISQDDIKKLQYSADGSPHGNIVTSGSLDVDTFFY
jgi:hypothetical protein